MSARRDPDELIHRFLLEGSERLHDQVYDAVRVEIDRKRQRAVLGPWRVPDIMNRVALVAGTAIALVLVVVVGSQVLAPGGMGGAGAGATPSPTASPTPAATSASDGSLPVGSSYVLINERGVRGSVTIPASGWFGDAGILARDSVDPPAGAGMITFTGDLNVYGDPCAWSTNPAETPATTPDELVAALALQASRDASEPVAVTIDGYVGKRITLHVPADLEYKEAGSFVACDQGYFGSWGVPGPDPSPYRWHQGPGQIDEVWAVDVDGVLTVIDTAYYEGTPEDQVAQLRAIVESMQFD